MNPWWILLIGMAIVIGGVLVLRLHAFVALILAALVVAMLTTPDMRYEAAIAPFAQPIDYVADGTTHFTPFSNEWTICYQLGNSRDVLNRLPTSDAFVIPLERILRVRPTPANGDLKFQEAVRRVGTTGFFHAGTCQLFISYGDAVAVPAHEQELLRAFPPRLADILVHPDYHRKAASIAEQSAGSRVAEGFGRTAWNIGILIALAAIIGKCLLDSGAAERIVAGMAGLFGEKRSAHAFLGSGFVLGIPVFFDTVFYLLMPLGKAMGMRTGRNYLLYVLAIVAGATMTHSLVPPTPGPLFVAEALNVEMGVMMLGGLAVGVVTVTSGYVYATWANRRWPIPVRPSAELSEAELAAMSRQHRGAEMSVWIALLPIFLPVVLIAGGTIIDEFELGANSPALRSAIKAVTEKNAALAIAAGVAMGMLAWSHKRAGAARGEVAKAVQSALAGGGVIILITCAGGAFGHVLNQTGIAHTVEASMPTAGSSLWLLPIAFIITAVVRIAQGSATVAMITGVGVVAPLALAGTLPYHPVYLALAIGCGSKPIPWMNDSGFWIISRMSGMTEGETLRTASAMMSLMGVVGLVVTMVGAWILPLV